MIELTKLEPSIRLDIRYATSNNFLGIAVYDEARAFLQRPAADSLVGAHRELNELGFGLMIFDGYRPWSVTKIFWERVRPEERIYVADPDEGSRHNRGCAVDLSMFSLATNELVPMPSDFDEFNEKAHPDYSAAVTIEKENRDLLRKVMESNGFTVNRNEWWHFDHHDWNEYEILDLTFDEIDSA